MLIGLSGKARSGKDSIATHLYGEFYFKRLAFADKLKQVCKEMFDLSDEQVYGSKKEEIDGRYWKTPRYILQHIGTEGFRFIDPDIWHRIVLKDCDKYVSPEVKTTGMIRSPKRHAVITDVRFKNEADAIREKGGLLWRIVREDHDGASGGIEGHASEMELDNVPDDYFDCVLSAKSGELQALYNLADAEVRRLLERRVP